jgi:hypothetical protein
MAPLGYLEAPAAVVTEEGVAFGPWSNTRLPHAMNTERSIFVPTLG